MAPKSPGKQDLPPYFNIDPGFAAKRLKSLQKTYGRRSVGVITSSRCTNEETYLVQKLARGVFMNNNTDTCARVCHSPTGYGLRQTFGNSAGTQDFDSVDKTDVVIVIGANPTDGHPVFASRLRKRLRQGARLIVVDPRRTDIVRSPHVEAAYHLPLRPGTKGLMEMIRFSFENKGSPGFLVTKQVRRNSKKDRKTFKTQGAPGFFGVCGAAFCCFFNF